MLGNWKTTENLLLSIKVWNLMPNAEVVKTNIKKRIQEEGLRTYLVFRLLRSFIAINNLLFKI